MKDGVGLGPGMGGGGGMGLGGPGLPPGISPHILQQLGIEGPVTSTVFVANVNIHVCPCVNIILHCCFPCTCIIS